MKFMNNLTWKLKLTAGFVLIALLAVLKEIAAIKDANNKAQAEFDKNFSETLSAEEKGYYNAFKAAQEEWRSERDKSVQLTEAGKYTEASQFLQDALKANDKALENIN